MRSAPWTTRRALATCAVALGSVLSAVALQPGPVGASDREPADWQTRFVATAGRSDTFTLGRTFMEIGPTGKSVILYASGPDENNAFDLRLARGPYPDGSFHKERVDPDDELVTGYGSLAVGPFGRTHVSYVSGVFHDQGVLRYAVRKAHGGWTRTVVDPVTSVGQTAIALDSARRPVIAYTKVNTQLRLATKTAAGWETEQVDAGEVVALDVAIDAQDRPVIAYVIWDGSDYVARVARYNGSSWSFEPVGHVSSEGIEFGIDLLLAPDGSADVAYPVLEPVRGLAHSHSSVPGAPWDAQLVQAGDLWQPTLAAGPDGDLHVVYYGATRGCVRYGQLVADQWQLGTVADSTSPSVRMGRLSSIAVDADGPRIAYYVGREFGGSTLRYAVPAD